MVHASVYATSGLQSHLTAIDLHVCHLQAHRQHNCNRTHGEDLGVNHPAQKLTKMRTPCFGKTAYGMKCCNSSNWGKSAVLNHLLDPTFDRSLHCCIAAASKSRDAQKHNCTGSTEHYVTTAQNALSTLSWQPCCLCYSSSLRWHELVLLSAHTTDTLRFSQSCTLLADRSRVECSSD